MPDKKATIVKVSKLPGVITFKTLKEAIDQVSADLAILHSQEAAKVLKKGSR